MNPNALNSSSPRSVLDCGDGVCGVTALAWAWAARETYKRRSVSHGERKAATAPLPCHRSPKPGGHSRHPCQGASSLSCGVVLYWPNSQDSFLMLPREHPPPGAPAKLR